MRPGAGAAGAGPKPGGGITPNNEGALRLRSTDPTAATARRGTDMNLTGHRGRAASRAGETSLSGVLLDQSHSHPEAGVLQWGAVGAIILGVLIGAAALITGIVWLAVPAVVVTLAGIATGLTTNIMNTTEDYDMAGRGRA